MGNDDQILNWKAVPVTDILGDVAADIALGALDGLARVVALQERGIAILTVTDHKVTGHTLAISTDDRHHQTVVDRYHAIEATQEETNKRVADIAAIGGGRHLVKAGELRTKLKAVTILIIDIMSPKMTLDVI